VGAFIDTAQKVQSHVKDFTTPRDSLKDLNPEVTGSLLTAATDVALIVDFDGTIRDLAFGSEGMSKEGYADWLGRRWIDTVTIESRPKVEALMRDVAKREATTWRHINHPSSQGQDVPVLYSAIRIGQRDRALAVGRDLRPVAALQQRLVDAQQSIEREHWRLRQVEVRYRLLFQMSSEPILIVDAATLKVVEANPAALNLFIGTGRSLVGRKLAEQLDGPSMDALMGVLAGLQANGRADDVEGRLIDGPISVVISSSLVRSEDSLLYLLRISAEPPSRGTGTADRSNSAVLKVIENGPDALVVTTLDGAILTANPAFLEIVQLAREDQVRGQPFERWFGQQGPDFSVLMANLNRRGALRLFETVLRDDYGMSVDVEISAVAVPNGDPPCLGFMIRRVNRRVTTSSIAKREMPRSVDQLSELVGRVPLKDLVREATDVIERLCIEAALELTKDNRASAAEMLGLSRQSLYVKLRRYGLADSAGDADSQP
jgi:transcriptional regulator PpsR